MEKLINQSQDKVLLNDLHRAEAFFSRLRGLMGKTITKDEGLLIRPCNSVHTFFMKMPIDVLFLNEDDVVIRKVSNMQQRRVSPIVRGAKYAIEGHPGVFDGVAVGDTLTVE